MTTLRARSVARRLSGALLALGAVTLTGCFDKPAIEERWTRVDLQASAPAARQALAPGSSQTVTVHATVTYRTILTGFAVAELRAGDGFVAGTTMDVQPDAPRVPMALSIDYLLQHSRSLGRSTRAVTGWDHLVQPLDFSFDATTPAGADTSGNMSRLFLLCYLGSGERMELAGGGDSIVVTPFVSSEREVLPVGTELFVSGAP